MPDAPRYESSTIARRSLLVGLAVLLGVIAISTVVAALLTSLWWPARARESTGVGVFRASKIDPELERARVEREARWIEESRSYAWIDRETGIARIPVERAVELVLGETERCP